MRFASDGPVVAGQAKEEMYAWRGPSLLILDTQGQSGSSQLTGFFFRSVRCLRELRIDINGDPPFLCSTASIEPNILEFTYTYPERKGGGSDQGGEHRGIRYRSIDLRLRLEVHPAGLTATLSLTNRWLDSVDIQLGWIVSADFADRGEVQAGRTPDQQQGEAESKPNGVTFRIQEPIPFATEVRVEGDGSWQFAAGRLSSHLSLRRQSTTTVKLQVRAIDETDPIHAEEPRRREHALDSWTRGVTQVESISGSPIAQMINGAMRDLGSLALLEGDEAEWLTPAAGIPRFPDLWARDALTAVWQASIFDRGEMAHSVLSRLGQLQGTRDDAWRDEQPGRIIRAAERRPAARLNRMPFGRYYGDYASPFAFIFALGQLYAWSGNRELLRRHWDAARRIIDWARERGDLDGDGYLEYRTLSPAGPKHQGWKDSANAVVYEDGRQVEPPFAPAEIQAYYFAALQFMAWLSVAMRHPVEGRSYWTAASELKERFNRDFWLEDEGCVAFGLDSKKRLVKTIVSNAGHCLTAGIVDDDKLPRLVRRIFEPDMFSGWGIRTLSSSNPAYNPLSYHLGSIWPVENATILFGLRRFGFDGEAQRLARAIYELALLWKGYRIPECVGGYSREEIGHPGVFPEANPLQAWNASAFPLLVQTILGLHAVASLRLLVLDPVLPDWLPDITVRGLRVGDATVSLRFFRDTNGESKYQVLAKAGRLRIVRQPPIDSLRANIGDRLRAAVRQLMAG